MRHPAMAAVAVLVLVVLLASVTAWARTEVTVRVGDSRQGRHGGHGDQSYWQDPLLDGLFDFSRGSQFYDFSRGSQFYDFGIGNWDTSSRLDDWRQPLYGSPNNRDRRQRGRNQQRRDNCGPLDYYYGSPAVLPYYYGNGYYTQPNIVFTAPSYPALGYYRQDYGYPDYGYSEPPVQTYDNRVYNNYYYYGGQPQAPAAPAAPDYYPPQPPNAAPAPPAAPAAPQDFVGPAKPATPSVPAAPSAPGSALLVPAGRSYGTRFYDQTRLDTPEGEFKCVLESGKLTGTYDGGKPYRISSAAEQQFGAFALYEPGSGCSVLFREGASLIAAYPVGASEWWLEPLPYSVDFKQDVSLGMVGGAPWVTFGALDGDRYVVSFSGRKWLEVGSGSRP